MIDFLSNSILQSFLFSPLMGVIFGIVFSGLTPSSATGTHLTVIQTKRIYVERRTSQSKNTDNDGSLLLLLGLVALFVLWKYVQLAHVIHSYMYTSLAAIFAFCITGFVLSMMKHRFVTQDWLLHVLGPTVILALCFPLLSLAKSAISPELVDLANRMNLWEFYFKGLTEYGRYFILFQLVGVCLLVIVALMSSMAFIHYLSLMNQQEYGLLTSFWSFITQLTVQLSGASALVFMIVLSIASWLLLNGQVAHWVLGNQG